MLAIVIRPLTLLAAVAFAQSPSGPAFGSQPPAPNTTSAAGQATPPRPIPQGQRIVAQDGDTVVVEPGTRLRLIRRTDANIRALYSAADHRIIVLADYSDRINGGPDGVVDETFVFRDVDGQWPLGDRWDGSASIDEYFSVDTGITAGGLGITTPAGLIQLSSPSRGFVQFRDGTAVASLTYRSSTRGLVRNLSFDAAEQRALAAETSAAMNRGLPQPLMTQGGAAGTMAPVRVGGNIGPPKKIVDVKPAYPEDAQKARVTGVVILEAIIAPDGSVQSAQVLRSIPLLDAAALDAVKQWRFTPTMLNGVAVPVIMTVTVNFSLQN